MLLLVDGASAPLRGSDAAGRTTRVPLSSFDSCNVFDTDDDDVVELVVLLAADTGDAIEFEPLLLRY